MKVLYPSMLVLLMTSCAGNVDDPYTNIRAKTQCPIGYHLEETNSVVVYDNEKDKQKKLKNTRIEFKCIVDSDQKKFINNN